MSNNYKIIFFLSLVVLSSGCTQISTIDRIHLAFSNIDSYQLIREFYSIDDAMLESNYTMIEYYKFPLNAAFKTISDNITYSESYYDNNLVYVHCVGEFYEYYDEQFNNESLSISEIDFTKDLNDLNINIVNESSEIIVINVNGEKRYNDQFYYINKTTYFPFKIESISSAFNYTEYIDLRTNININESSFIPTGFIINSSECDNLIEQAYSISNLTQNYKWFKEPLLNDSSIVIVSKDFNEKNFYTCTEGESISIEYYINSSNFYYDIYSCYNIPSYAELLTEYMDVDIYYGETDYNGNILSDYSFEYEDKVYFISYEQGDFIDSSITSEQAISLLKSVINQLKE
ncbi:MAG: hypothetical protein PHN56_03400 [Candidatus Nanoarchaeia archaeon]|nr:hypothetical protein [Candidatus Nanoarchaeia archaeon]